MIGCVAGRVFSRRAEGRVGPALSRRLGVGPAGAARLIGGAACRRVPPSFGVTGDLSDPAACPTTASGPPAAARRPPDASQLGGRCYIHSCTALRADRKFKIVVVVQEGS